MQNENIEKIFKDFKIDGTPIPISFMQYDGKAETYITYQATGEEPAYWYDNRIYECRDMIDIDIYSKHNYIDIVDKVISLMNDNDYYWTGNGADQYEQDTGYYHKTIEFEKERMM